MLVMRPFKRSGNEEQCPVITEQKEKCIYISQISIVLDMSMVSLHTMNLCQGGRLSEIFDFVHT